MSGQPVVGFNHIRLESTAAGDQAGSWMNLPPFHHPVGQVLGSSNGSGKEALALFSDKGGGDGNFLHDWYFFPQNSQTVHYPPVFRGAIYTNVCLRQT